MPSPQRLFFRCRAAVLAAAAWLAVSALPAARAEPWDASRCRLLFDRCFAAVEADAAGRTVRHCPHHDLAGELDADQLVWQLGTLTDHRFHHPATRREAERHLRHHYQQLRREWLPQEVPVVELNRAGAAELVRLPGIGPCLAVRILRYRRAHGPFAQPSDLLRVSGIGPGTLAAVRHYLLVR